MASELLTQLLAELAELMEATSGLADDTTDEAQAERAAELTERIAVLQARDEVRARSESFLAPRPAGGPAFLPGGRQPDTIERAFDHYLRTGMANQDITQLRAQGEGVPSEGGYLVPDGFRDKLVEVRKAYGGLSEFADNFSTTTGQSLEYPTLNDTANVGAITAESASFEGGADLVFGTVSLGAYKYTSSGADSGGNNTPLRVSVELLQDAAFDVAGLISRKLGERIARKQAADWITGTGVSQPQGIFQGAADQNVDVADVLDYDDLLTAEAALDPEYEQNARWIMSKGTWTVVRALVDGATRPLIFDQAASGIGGRPEKQLLGYPVIIDQAATTFGAATGPSTNLAIGDWSEAYAIRRVANVVVVVNPWTRANNGEVEYTAYERADGVVQNRAAYISVANL